MKMEIIQQKACKKCGTVERMGPDCDTCLKCRVQEYKEGGLSRKQIYYLLNRERFIKKARENYFKNKKAKMQERRACYKERRKFTVHFEKTEGGYCWKAWFRNPDTERLVRFESDGYFDTIQKAREDYLQATS